MSAKVTVYVTSVSSSQAIKKSQERIKDVLDANKIDYELVDISAGADLKDEMRKLANDSKCLPPQICNGTEYCGDYNKFEEAVEDECLRDFLKI